ncbi:MAG: hypothetical protein IM638_06115 [Bacteroidetes bacterium]|nr:hypothetical protein [Bacteroidota bacterium]
MLSAVLPAQNRAAVAAQLARTGLQPVKYSPEAVLAGRQVLWLEMPFASSAFVDARQAASLRGKQVERVDLVYTQFAVSPRFDQQTLNNRRLDELQRQVPAIFANALTEWRLVGQTGATSPASGRTFFHGFVVVVRETASPELTRKELRFLDSLLGKPPGDGGSVVTGGTTGSSGTTSGGGILKGTTGIVTMGGVPVRIRRSIPDDSLRFYLRASHSDGTVVEARWTDSAHTTIAYTERVMDHRRRLSITLSEDSLFAAGPRSRLLSGYSKHNPDSVIMSTLRRNNWSNIAIVCDVTGSMSPYTAQLFAWIEQTQASGRCKHYLFFNDGDNKRTGQKTNGKTGGLYPVMSGDFDTVCRKAAECMHAGDGGDIPENYIEALLAALKQFPATTEIVLIADNWASPRDLELFEKLNRPVHIILCGSRTGVNIDYLFLARQTGGSLHTVNQDINNLGTMKDGEYVQIGRQRFILRDERFIMVTDELMIN